MACESFVDGVINDFVHHVMQARAIIGIADIHARTLADSVQPLQNLDGIGAVGVSGFSAAVFFAHDWGRPLKFGSEDIDSSYVSYPK